MPDSRDALMRKAKLTLELQRWELCCQFKMSSIRYLAFLPGG